MSAKRNQHRIAIMRGPLNKCLKQLFDDGYRVLDFRQGNDWLEWRFKVMKKDEPS